MARGYGGMGRTPIGLALTLGALLTASSTLDGSEYAPPDGAVRPKRPKHRPVSDLHGPCSYRATGNKRSRRRQKGKAEPLPATSRSTP